MDLHLTPEQQSLIQELVEEGQFPDSDAVVAEALRLLVNQIRAGEFRDKLNVGLEQLERGESVEFTPELGAAALARAIQRAANGETPHSDACPR